MSLTPKNWDAFQHYKDRSPAWIKLHRGLLDDFAFSRLPVASRALAPLLWLLASEYEGGKIEATNEEIAFRFRMTLDEMLDGLKPLIDAGFFASDSKPLARRKRAAIPEREEEKQVETEKEKTIGHFENFKKAYPKRKGPNPWAPARKLFEAAVSAGTDPLVIIAALRAGVGINREKIGTEFIPHARKWLHDRCWEDYQPPPTAGPSQAPNGAPTDEELRKKYGQSPAVPTETKAAGANGAGADHGAELRDASAEIRPVLRAF